MKRPSNKRAAKNRPPLPASSVDLSVEDELPRAAIVALLAERSMAATGARDRRREEDKIRHDIKEALKKNELHYCNGESATFRLGSVVAWARKKWSARNKSPETPYDDLPLDRANFTLHINLGEVLLRAVAVSTPRSSEECRAELLELKTQLELLKEELAKRDHEIQRLRVIEERDLERKENNRSSGQKGGRGRKA